MKSIDFSPSVFDDRKAEVQQPASSSWTPWVFAAVLLLSVGGSAIYFFLKFSAPSPLVAPSPVFHSPLDRDSVPGIPMGRAVESNIQKVNCMGDEIICTVAVANKPVELLHKLVSAIPISGAKQYRVRLSITAIDEPADESSAVSK